MTIAVDFDGVIHAYRKGWQDGTIYDPPMPGALDGLRTLMAADAVFIFTTRDISQVASWLLERGFSVRVGHDGPFWNERGRLLITNQKLAATAYLDDRAVRFENWDQALAVLGADPPLNPHYSHETCGFRWHGRDGLDLPMRDGQPVCPRCELERTRAALDRVRKALGTTFMAGPNAVSVVRADAVRAALDEPKEQ
ncbi:hypothetical protein [Streptomyces sp. NBC_00035]|uniref:hypothetical protein n=1 Tax=Streptomyces sp. NBC_00035 TaxID=2903614 RepID=UPI00324BE866